MTRLMISLVVKALLGHACDSETTERFPRKIDITNTGLKPQAVSVRTEASGYSGWMRTISNSSAHYLPQHQVQCVDEGTDTSPRKVFD